MVGRTLCFLATFLLLQVVWQLALSQDMRNEIVRATVVLPAATLVRSLTPELVVRNEGTSLMTHARGGRYTGGLNIVNGCDGTDMLFLLCAAFVAIPLRLRARVAGVALGGAIVYALNQVRVLALLYTQRGDPALFDVLHGYLAPLIMVVVLALYFQVWTRRVAATRPG